MFLRLAPCVISTCDRQIGETNKQSLGNVSALQSSDLTSDLARCISIWPAVSRCWHPIWKCGDVNARARSPSFSDWLHSSVAFPLRSRSLLGCLPLFYRLHFSIAFTSRSPSLSDWLHSSVAFTLGLPSFSILFHSSVVLPLRSLSFFGCLPIASLDRLHTRS